MIVTRTLLQRSGVLAIFFAGVWSSGCGAESPEVPGDDDDESGGASMGGTAGSFAGTPPTGGTGFAGTPGTGGTPATGGTAGTPGTGGTGFAGVGTGGTPVTGGTGGTGTAMCLTSNVGAATDTAIDNLEDGDNTVGNGATDPMPPVRIGYWYTYNDGTCSPAQMPAPDPSGAIPFVPAPGQGNAASIGARTSGGACTTWGAGMGFDLNNCNAKSNSYNAAAYSGISFWYKSTTGLRVIVSTIPVIPTDRGGTCTGTECDNGHGYTLAAAPTGMQISVPFTMLNQEFGTMTAFDATQVVNVQWQVPMAAAFDFTIDDIAFTP